MFVEKIDNNDLCEFVAEPVLAFGWELTESIASNLHHAGVMCGQELINTGWFEKISSYSGGFDFRIDLTPRECVQIRAHYLLYGFWAKTINFY